MTLLEAIGKVPPGTMYHIGSKSSFVFVVNRQEFNTLVPTEWKLRNVIEYYPRLQGGWAFVVTGCESGHSWNRDEFLERLEKFYDKGNDYSVFHTVSPRGLWRNE